MADQTYDESIRKDERWRLAELLDEHAETLGEFPTDTVACVKLIAWLLRLDHAPAGGG